MGRTGVFITLSIVLERMRYEGVVDMFQTVKMLRTQRPAMVQTEVSPYETIQLRIGLVKSCQFSGQNEIKPKLMVMSSSNLTVFFVIKTLASGCLFFLFILSSLGQSQAKLSSCTIPRAIKDILLLIFYETLLTTVFFF